MPSFDMGVDPRTIILTFLAGPQSAPHGGGKKDQELTLCGVVDHGTNDFYRCFLGSCNTFVRGGRKKRGGN